MMRHCFTLIAVLLGMSACTQDRGWLESHARAYLDTLTSPAFHGRGYVNGGDAIAADWIGVQFERFGLKPVKKDLFQPFTFNVNSFPDSIKVAIDGKVLLPGTDFIVSANSGSAKGSYHLVHLTIDDLLTPERRAMTMGVITGKAACIHFGSTTDRNTLAMYRAFEQELMLDTELMDEFCLENEHSYEHMIAEPKN